MGQRSRENVHLQENGDAQTGLDALRSSEAFHRPNISSNGHDSNEHLILLYERQAQQFDAVVPFVRQGLQRGERCLYTVHDNSRKEVLDAMRAGGIDVDSALDSGALTIHTAEDVYFQDGEFDPSGLVSTMAANIDETLTEYEGFRATGEMTWVLDERAQLDDVSEYENLVNRLYERPDCLGLCQYNRDRFPPKQLRRIIESHPHVIHDNTISQNIYYTPPDELFSADEATREIDRMLETTLEPTRAEAALEERNHFFRNLYEITSYRDRPFEEKLEEMLELGCDFFGLDIGSLTHLPEDDTEYKIDAIVGSVPSNFEGTPPVQPEPGCFCWQTLEQDGPVGITDVRDIGWDHDLLYQKYGLTAYFGVKVSNGSEPYGTLWFGDTESRDTPFTDAEYTTLELMGRWVSYEIERREYEQRLCRQKNSLARANQSNTLVRNLVRAFVEEETRVDIEQRVCDRLTASDFYRAAWIGDRPLSTQRLTPRVCAGIRDDSADAIVDTSGPETEGVANQALSTGQLQVVRTADLSASAYREQLRQRDIESALAVPIVQGETQYGILAVYATRPDAFDTHQQLLFENFGESLGFAITAAERKQALITDELIELDVRLRHPEHFLIQATAETDASITVDGIFDHSEGAKLVYTTVTDVPAETILDCAADSADIEAARLVRESGQEALVELVYTGPAVADTFAEHGAMVTTFTISDGEAMSTVELPRQADVRTIVEGVRPTFTTLDVVAKRTVNRPMRTGPEFRPTFTEHLTDKQQATLRAAYFSGYFDRPRTSTGDDVAEALDISSSTFHQHLRIGLRKLLAAAFDDSPTQ